MKKSLVLSAILLGVCMISLPNNADALVLNLDTVFTGKSAPDGTGPWAVLTFVDSGSNTVQLTIENKLQGSNDFITELDFNSSVLGLTFTLDTTKTIGVVTAPTISQGFDSYKADGDGYFDIGLGFVTKNNDPGRFQGEEKIVYTITGSGITAETFNLFSSSGGGEGTYTAAAHVQNIAGGDSTWIGSTNPVPEPATMLLFGTGIAGLAGMARRKR